MDLGEHKIANKVNKWTKEKEAAEYLHSWNYSSEISQEHI